MSNRAVDVPTSRFVSRHRLAQTVSALLLLYAIANLGLAAAVYRLVWHVLQRRPASAPEVLSESLATWNRLSTAYWIRGAAVAIPTVLFMVWLYHAHRNLRSLGARRIRFNSHWAVTGFLVPAMNLFRPFQVVQEVWRESLNGSSGASDRTDPHAALWPRLWWELFLMTIAANLVAASVFRGERLEQSGFLLWMFLQSAVLFAVWTGVVLRIDRAQTSMARRESRGHSAGKSTRLPTFSIDGAVLLVLLAALWVIHYGAARAVVQGFEGRDVEFAAGTEGSEGVAELEGLIDVPIEVPEAVGVAPRSTETGRDTLEVITFPDLFPAFKDEQQAKEIVLRHYPAIAREAGMEGNVYVRVLVDTLGRVVEAQVERAWGPPLDEAAVRAAHEFEFTPGELRGRKIPVSLVLPIRFELPRQP